ncbi:MAG TPA: photosynthetic reaction center cytochrome c subunit family protein [Bryobacteraceae bacterium]|nr:photosynthetic reaction center cytochrome c subunit family protein [Bryobacteraceae bacterium]
MKILKRLVGTGVGASLVGGAVLFAQSGSTAAKPRMADDVFKNIQVLKGLTVDDFMGAMGLFSAALNVCCGDCHVGAGGSDPKWADDTPPRKKIARRMVTIMNNINKEQFGGRQVITCWTCHRGSTPPATTPSIDNIYSDPVSIPPDVLPAATASLGALPADQVLDKFIQALGGADNLAKLTSYTATGKSLRFDEVKADTVELYAKAPNMLATTIHEREGDLSRVSNGKNAWVMLPLTVLGEWELTDGASQGARLDAQMAFPGNIKQLFTNWKSSFPITLNGRDVYVVQGGTPSGLLATFYFDKQTGLLNRLVHYYPSAVGRVPTQIDYSDYRPVAGVMLPFKWTYGWVSGREEYEMTEYTPNVPVDDSKFNEPVQRAK